MRVGRRLAGILGWVAIVAGCAPAAAPAASPAVTGISDGGTAFFDSAHYRALDLQTVRLVLPWDAGVRRGAWDDWLERAAVDGADVMVALSHDEHSRCPSAPCSRPPDAAYRDALAALVERHQNIRHVIPWNEPNHASQPTAGAPEAAARYAALARGACARCTVVAGNLLDDASMPGYLDRYRRALTITPDVWGLHSYWDTTYFLSQGVDHLLAAVDGPVWLTETGGIVSFGALPYDEARAGASVRWAYALADARPRVGRLYLHQWQGTPTNPFDSGLLDYFGRPRPGYEVVSGRVGPRPGRDAQGPVVTAAAAQSSGRTEAARARTSLRVAGVRLRLLSRRRLELPLSCAAGPGVVCRGVVRVRVDGRARGGVRAQLPAGRTVRRMIRLSRPARRFLVRAKRPRVEVRVCDLQGECAAARMLAVAPSRAARRDGTRVR